MEETPEGLAAAAATREAAKQKKRQFDDQVGSDVTLGTDATDASVVSISITFDAVDFAQARHYSSLTAVTAWVSCIALSSRYDT